MREYETIDWAVTDRVLILSLARPHKLNAFTVQMCEELVDAFDRVNEDKDVGAVVVTGQGRAFCAGMDLSVEGNVFGLREGEEPSQAQLLEELDDPRMIHGIRDTGGRVTLAIFGCQKPVIGAINGVAVGIGSTMTLPMDARLASSDARFGFVFGRLGIVPEACSSWFLPRLVGMPQALAWMYKADIFDAQEALRGGLIQSIYESERLIDEAIAFARSFIQDRSPAAVALTRQMLWRNSAASHPLHAHIVDSLAVLAMSARDGKEGVAAFREKRAPAFNTGPDALPRDLQDWLRAVGAHAPG